MQSQVIGETASDEVIHSSGSFLADQVLASVPISVTTHIGSDGGDHVSH